MCDDEDQTLRQWYEATRRQSHRLWKGKGEGKGKWKSKSKRKGGKGKVQGWVISEEAFSTFFGNHAERDGDHGSGATSSWDAPPQVGDVKDEVKQETTPAEHDGLEPDGASDLSGCIPPPMGDPRRSDYLWHVKQWLQNTFTVAERVTLMI
jgi:hypothetical protein